MIYLVRLLWYLFFSVAIPFIVTSFIKGGAEWTEQVRLNFVFFGVICTVFALFLDWAADATKDIARELERNMRQ